MDEAVGVTVNVAVLAPAAGVGFTLPGTGLNVNVPDGIPPGRPGLLSVAVNVTVPPGATFVVEAASVIVVGAGAIVSTPGTVVIV